MLIFSIVQATKHILPGQKKTCCWAVVVIKHARPKKTEMGISKQDEREEQPIQTCKVD